MLNELCDAREEIERLRVALREAKGVMEWIQESSGRDLGEEIAAIEAVLTEETPPDADSKHSQT
jgi:hypothetical protein